MQIREFIVTYWNCNVFKFERFYAYALDERQILDDINKRVPEHMRITPNIGGDSLRIRDTNNVQDFPIFWQIGMSYS